MDRGGELMDCQVVSRMDFGSGSPKPLPNRDMRKIKFDLSVIRWQVWVYIQMDSPPVFESSRPKIVSSDQEKSLDFTQLEIFESEGLVTLVFLQLP